MMTTISQILRGKQARVVLTHIIFYNIIKCTYNATKSRCSPKLEDEIDSRISPHKIYRNFGEFISLKAVKFPDIS